MSKIAYFSVSFVVTIFVSDNHGGDISVIKNIELFGTPIHGTDVAKIQSSGCC
jgi:hypothetical protein